MGVWFSRYDVSPSYLYVSICNMIREADISYIAGLFDGEGSIEFTKRKEKKRNGTYKCRRISMEISMTDESVLLWVLEVLGCGTLTKKPRKLPKIQQVIDHYGNKLMNGKVVNLNDYREAMSQE